MRVSARLGASIEAHSRDVNGVAFSNKLLASCSGDKTVRLWHIGTWEEADCSPLTGHTYYVNYVVFSPFNTILASCSTDGNVIFWDPNSGGQLCMFTHPSKCGVRVGTFSLNSQLFASGSEDGSICLWDIPSKSLLRTLSGHEGSVLGLSFTPDSLYLVSGSTSGDLRVWDAKYGHAKTLFLILDGHDLGVTAADISPVIDATGGAAGPTNTYTLATAGSDNLVKVWRLVANTASMRISLNFAWPLKGHSSAVMSVRFSPSGKLLISCSVDHTVRIWQPETAASLHVIDAHSRYVTSCCFSNDGQLIASGSNDRLVRVWNLSVDEDAEEDDSPNAEASASDWQQQQQQQQQQQLPWCPVYAWTADHVARFFTQLGLGQYVRSVYQQAVDGQVLMSLTDEQLSSELGIPVLGHRRKLLTAIEAMRDNRVVAECDAGVPDEYLCPVTREIMQDPVIAADGYTYERSAIESWFGRGRSVSPMTNEPISNCSLIPNRSLRMLIRRYLEDAR